MELVSSQFFCKQVDTTISTNGQSRNIQKYNLKTLIEDMLQKIPNPNGINNRIFENLETVVQNSTVFRTKMSPIPIHRCLRAEMKYLTAWSV